MNQKSKVYMVGGGIGTLSAAAFLIRDGKLPGANISILEALPLMGGSLDAGGSPIDGYSMRGGRMLTLDNYECTWNLFRSIPSLKTPGTSVFEETQNFNQVYRSNAKARLVDRDLAKVPVKSMGFSMQDRMELLKLSSASEESLGNSSITDWLSPHLFKTEFWFMWSTTFAFQPWHSAIEFKRYLHRFILEFSRIDTLAGVNRTIYNQYDSLVLPLQKWLSSQGVHFVFNCKVTGLDHETDHGKVKVTKLFCEKSKHAEDIPIGDDDFVFLENGSMTDSSSLGSMASAPEMLSETTSPGWVLWEALAEGHPEFGNPQSFNDCIAQSCWESFTVTLKQRDFFKRMERFSGNEAGTGGLVTFKDSNWLMSVVLPHQPHFINQPEGVEVFWGYGLFPDRIGNFVPKAMSDCNGEDILKELCGHLHFDLDAVKSAICIPCRMPYITSMFMPRSLEDRPLPVPKNSKNIAFISQFVEIPKDVVFTVEYSVRAAQMAVYELMDLKLDIPPVTPHDSSLLVRFETVLEALK